MNRIVILCLLLTAATHNLFSQTVIEDVSFDNYVNTGNNDLVNHFTGGLGLSAIVNNGITGGCLLTPNTISWGNDNAIYCSKYVDSASYATNTRISFKYDTTLINSINFDRAVSIFLRPNADFNHYVIASVTHNQKIQLLTYSYASTLNITTMIHNHWYELMLTTNCSPSLPAYQINLSTTLNDLGLTGMDPPLYAASAVGTITDSLLFVDNAVQVSITGAAWGGAKYLDDFHFQGRKSADSCIIIPNALPEQSEACDIIITDENIQLQNFTDDMFVEIIDVTGHRVFSRQIGSGISLIDISQFSVGTYFIRLNNSAFSSNRKFIIVN